MSRKKAGESNSPRKEVDAGDTTPSEVGKVNPKISGETEPTVSFDENDKAEESGATNENLTEEITENKPEGIRSKACVGSDLDGVLACNNYDRKKYRPNMPPYYEKCYPTKLAEKQYQYVITGRSEQYRKLTEEWCKEHGVKYDHLIMRPKGTKKNNKTLGKFKEETIKEHGITKFYEDDAKIAKHLQDTCPNTEIVHIEYIQPLKFQLHYDPRLKNLFPPLPKEKQDALKESIEERGMIDKLKVDSKGAILDGMQRFGILMELGKEDQAEYDKFNFPNHLERMNFAIKYNIDRRAPNSYQRARAVLMTEQYYREQAKENQGRRTDIEGSEPPKSMNTREAMAKIAHVGTKTIDMVKYIERCGTMKHTNAGLEGKTIIDVHFAVLCHAIESDELKKIVRKRKKNRDGVSKVLKKEISEEVKQKIIKNKLFAFIDNILGCKTEQDQLAAIDKILEDIRKKEEPGPIKKVEIPPDQKDEDQTLQIPTTGVQDQQVPDIKTTWETLETKGEDLQMGGTFSSPFDNQNTGFSSVHEIARLKEYLGSIYKIKATDLIQLPENQLETVMDYIRGVSDHLSKLIQDVMSSQRLQNHKWVDKDGNQNN